MQQAETCEEAVHLRGAVQDAAVDRAGVPGERRLSYLPQTKEPIATFIATTASNGARLKDAEAANKILQRYVWDGDTAAVILNDRDDGQAYVAVHGYDWPSAWRIPDGVNRDGFELDYDIDSYDGFEDFLKEIAPYLTEPLTVQAIGFEKCRFPLAACEWHVRPGASAIQVTAFEHSLEPVEAETVCPDAIAGSA